MDFSDLSENTELQKQSFLEDLKSKFKAVQEKNTELMTELNGLPPETEIRSDNKEAIIQGIKDVIAPVAEFGDNTTTYHFKNQGGQPVNITVNNDQSNISFETFGEKPTAFREALTPISNKATELKTGARGVEPERQPAIEEAARKLNRLVERFEYLASIFETRQYREFVIEVDNPVQLANAVVVAKTEADNLKLIADDASTLASNLQNETERARLDTREKKEDLDRAKAALDQTPGDARLENAVAVAQQEWEAAVEDFEQFAAASTNAKIGLKMQKKKLEWPQLLPPDYPVLAFWHTLTSFRKLFMPRHICTENLLPRHQPETFSKRRPLQPWTRKTQPTGYFRIYLNETKALLQADQLNR